MAILGIFNKQDTKQETSIVGKEIAIRVVDKATFDYVYLYWKPLITHIEVGKCVRNTKNVIGITTGTEDTKYFEIGTALGNATLIEVFE